MNKAFALDSLHIAILAIFASVADLVVLGAYGRSRMHEILFGSCTQSMIRNAETSVLVMH